MATEPHHNHHPSPQAPHQNKKFCASKEKLQLQQTENGGEMADVCWEFDHGNSMV